MQVVNLQSLRGLFAIFLSGATLVFASGCTRSEAPRDDVVSPSTAEPVRPFVVQLSSDPVSLNPFKAEDGAAVRILSNVMDGLMGYDASGRLVHRLAESHSVSDDGKTYRFTLRAGARWSDARPVTVDEMVSGIRRAMSAQTGSKFSQLLAMIESVNSRNGKVEIRLRHPVTQFLDSLTLVSAVPYRSDFDANWPVSGPVTGPFLLTRYELGKRVVLKRNPNYWANSKAADAPNSIDEIHFQIVSDDTVAANLFSSGRLDLLTRIAPLDIERLRKNGLVQEFPMAATYYLAFNQKKTPFQAVENRCAVAAAIDSRAVVSALSGADLPAKSWIPVGLEGYFDGVSFPWPPSEKAAQKVAAGKTALKSFRGRVALGTDSGQKNHWVVERVQALLKSKLGLESSIEALEWKSYVARLGVDAPAIYRFAWLAPYLDPLTHLQVFTSTNANNYTGWKSSRYDRLVDEIARLPVGRDRLAKINEAQRILLEEECVLIPIFHYTQSYAISRRVESLTVNPLSILRYDEIKVRR